MIFANNQITMVEITRVLYIIRSILGRLFLYDSEKKLFLRCGLGHFRCFLAMFSRPKPGVAGAVRPRQLKCCGIVGAGLMGGGIAMCCAEAGMKVGIGYQNARNMARVPLQNTHTKYAP